jgi:hypothetical protein
MLLKEPFSIASLLYDVLFEASLFLCFLKYHDSSSSFSWRAGVSYRSLGHVTERQVETQGRTQLLRNFLAKGADIEVDKSWTLIDRIIAQRTSARKKVGNGTVRM